MTMAPSSSRSSPRPSYWVDTEHLRIELVAGGRQLAVLDRELASLERRLDGRHLGPECGPDQRVLQVDPGDDRLDRRWGREQLQALDVHRPGDVVAVRGQTVAEHAHTLERFVQGETTLGLVLP